MASSSSSSSSLTTRTWLYHVFMSFRGEDVRTGFLSHVRKELKRNGIIAFVDDEMKRGKSVGPVLVGAIRQSKVAIVLLSPNYASSSWCLDELVEIMKCRREDQQTVMTIFYQVDPSDVRNQAGDFGKAFDETCVGKTEEVKQAWRQALNDVAGIAGYHSSNCDDEAEMINKVASDVTAVLSFTPSKDFDDFVGIGARITDIQSKLILQSEGVKVIVVVGPAGIGKTSTARVLYNQLSPGFPFSTFLENVKGSYEKPCGNDYHLKLRLQSDLLCGIFNQRDIEVRHLGVAKEMLSDKKVLVVLDEVDSWWQLEEMAKQSGWVGPGSIIIITTEDRKFLKTLRLGNDHIYEMKFPTSVESLQILCQYAFGQKFPDHGFEMLAWEVTGLAGNLPLGLRVMGSYLRGMSREEWIEALPWIRSTLDTEIESTLRFSYDALRDNEKALFLHIACFFFAGFKVDSFKRWVDNRAVKWVDCPTLMSTASAPVKRGKRRTSKAWKHFRIVGEKYPDGTHDVVCKFCKHTYNLNLRSGTNGMLRHIKVCTLNPVPSTPGAGRKIDQIVFREMIAVALIEHNLPYAFVEYRRVREALQYVNPRIEFWCRITAAKDCLKVYEKEKLKLRKQLDKIPGRFCLTTDLWRSLTIVGYMCLTVHFIDEEWNLKSRILDFCAFPPPHTGGAISMKIMDVLREWGLEKKVFTVTVDNASANDNMQLLLKRQLRRDLVCNGDFFHIRCVAHILNLIVQDGLSVIAGALEKIRESVKFVTVTESRRKLFQSCVETVGIEANENGVLPGLVMDVSTRWNSTHLMLDRAISYREAFRHLAEVETAYPFCPTELEWDRAVLIRDFLAPFAEMTALISGSSYPTANLYFMQVWSIEIWLKENQFNSDEVISEMVASMKPKFNKYWDEYCDILAIAAVLDPRLKLGFVEYCFTTLDASTSKVKVDHIRKKLKKLFDVYKKNKKKNIATSESKTATKTTIGGYGGYYAFITQNDDGNGKSALDKYLDEPVVDNIMAFETWNVLSYWKENANRLKELASMACDVLSIPITTVASESSFSIGSRVLNKYRSSLLPSNVRALICARNWLRGFESLDCDEVEELGEEVKEKLD